MRSLVTITMSPGGWRTRPEPSTSSVDTSEALTTTGTPSTDTGGVTSAGGQGTEATLVSADEPSNPSCGTHKPSLLAAPS